MAHPTDEIARLAHNVNQKDRDMIRVAYDYAEKAHGEEKRKSGEPYIVHPRAIALTLSRLGMDRDTIIAGILHDTIEDTPVTADDIEKEFGKTVRFLVESVTKLSKLKYRGVERHVESLRRLLVATASDLRVIIIKLADRLHNMETIEFVEPEEKRHRIALETMEVYVPIAARLGIGIIKSELEDLAYKVLEPTKFKDMSMFLEEREEKARPLLEEDMKDLKRALAEAGIRGFRTEMRIKGVHSFASKLARKANDIESVHDILAVRIIVPTVDNCYQAMGAVHSIWRPVVGRIKDYIAVPKPNGYRSLHSTIITKHKITVEVQIRTEAMHREAQFGVASHFSYKNKEDKPQTSVGWAWRFVPSLMKIARGEAKGLESPTVPSWLKDLTSAAEDYSEQKAFQTALKEDFFAERMFVFTPKGDVIDLPVGATPVDFAYAIHSAIGDGMVGAKVNGKMVTLASTLKDGDVVEILTKKNAKPNKKWLDYAKTTSAKHHIRTFLNKEN